MIYYATIKKGNNENRDPNILCIRITQRASENHSDCCDPSPASNSVDLGWHLRICVAKNSQGMLTPWVQGLHLENRWFKVLLSEKSKV